MAKMAIRARGARGHRGRGCRSGEEAHGEGPRLACDGASSDSPIATLRRALERVAQKPHSEEGCHLKLICPARKVYLPPHHAPLLPTDPSDEELARDWMLSVDDLAEVACSSPAMSSKSVSPPPVVVDHSLQLVTATRCNSAPSGP